MFGEFVGTLVLVLMGNGVVAGVLLKKSKAEGAGWMVVAAGWAFAVMCGIFTALACGSPAHLNPAVTLGAAVSSGDFSSFGPYFLAQMAGALVGAFLVWVYFFPHWRETKEPDLKRACFCTSPAIRSFIPNLICEVIGTFILVLVANAIGKGNPAAGVAPYLVASLVWGIGLCLGGTTGYAINPARDWGPRIAHSILPIPGKGDSDWGYAVVPMLGPLIGGALAGAFARWAFV